MVPKEKRPLRVFLCHASGDKPPVRELYKRLVIEGVDAWLDQEKLLPGQDWRLEIPRAVHEADVVVVCLSNKSVTKEGYVQKEIKFALDSAEEKPEGTIFLIPARLEDCIVPERLNRWQWVDLYEENGFIKLLRSLKLRANAVGATIEQTSYVDSDKELEKRIKQLYTEGLAAFYTEDWNKACHRFQSILGEQPNHKNASDKLAEAQRQRELSKLYDDATEAVRCQEWQTAITTLEELSRKSANYKDVVELLGNARKKKQLRELYAEAETLSAGQKWQAVVRVFEQISVIEPSYPDPGGLLAAAQKEVVELKRISDLNDLYINAVGEMDLNNWYEARKLLEQIHKAQIGFLETERLLKKVEDEITKLEEQNRRKEEVNVLYEQAHELLRSKKWQNALSKLEEIWKLDEHFPDTDGINEMAQKELEREEQETDRQNKLAALYAQSVRLLKEEKYQEALDTWQEVKAIDPKYPDRQRVQTTARRKLSGVRKTATIQNDLKTKLGRVFESKGIKPSEEIESSIEDQPRMGWLILFVAISWGIGRFTLEALMRLTNFFWLGVNFWSTAIMLGLFGLFSGAVIWLALRFMKIHISDKKLVALLAVWTLGYLIPPMMGWSIFWRINQWWGWDLGYPTAGLAIGCCTGLLLFSSDTINRIKSISVITLGLSLSLYLGGKIWGFPWDIGIPISPLIFDPLKIGAGSFTSGFFFFWIFYNQLNRPYDSVRFAKQVLSILFVATSWGIERFAIEILARITNFFSLGPNFWSTEIVVGTFALFYGVTIWSMLRFLKIDISNYKTIVLVAGWFIAFLLVPIIGWSFSAATNQSWNIGYISAGLVAGLFTAFVLVSEGLISYSMQVFIVAIGIALSIFLGEKVSGVLITDVLALKASYPLGLGSFIAGLFSTLVLVSQLSRQSVPPALLQTKIRLVTIKSLWTALGGILVISIIVLVVNIFGNNTSTPTVVVLNETCPTYPQGTNNEGFVSKSSDPLAPWLGNAIHFQGTDKCPNREMIGASSLIYRYRIEFNRVTKLTSVKVSGAAFNGPNSILRVLDQNKKVLRTISTSGGNTFKTFVITLEDVQGKVFFVDEFDTSSSWRFREVIIVNNQISR